MRFSFLLSLLIFLLLQGCSPTIQPIVKEGVLYINHADKSYVLADDAIDYNVIPSPDGSWLAVETRLLSNLQIIRIYQKNSHGKYHQLKNPIAVTLWNALSKTEGFSLDDVRYPKMRFLEWIDKNTISINMSGAFEDKIIDQNITLLLTN